MYVFINEASTIAAAYAIGQFMTVDGTTVNISAPANINAATSSCTLTSGQTTSCNAAGLAHAFLNAANLVNAVGTSGAPPTGFPYSALPNNSSAVVPQALINTLANSVEACVNSSGSSSTPCTNLMTDTTPPTALLASPNAPTNTLQALIDLAQYPGDGDAAPRDVHQHDGPLCHRIIDWLLSAQPQRRADGLHHRHQLHRHERRLIHRAVERYHGH
jgi:hypothetical protein